MPRTISTSGLSPADGVPASSSRRGLSNRPLTPKQLDALERAARGATHKQIATAQGIDVKTVGGIFQEIFRKLGGAETTAHAVYLACQRGVLDLGGARRETSSNSAEVSIAPSLRQLQSLIAEGFSVSFIAGRMGMGQPELSFVMARTHITTAMEARIRRAFEELAGRDPLELGVHPRGVTRARNRARAEGWGILPPLASRSVEDAA
ncbi:helix-turn-helix domain-containing protein [Streptomyces cinereoruber]|uniref:hypothetical protein n=1 Tax=Streptomyces cinereoruber TaxID=67260 RepID=UPI00364107A7